MMEILAGAIGVGVVGLLVWLQLRTPRIPPNAQLLFDLWKMCGKEAIHDHPGGNKASKDEDLKKNRDYDDKNSVYLRT